MALPISGINSSGFVRNALLVVKNIDSLRLLILRALELRSHPCSPAAMAGMSRCDMAELSGAPRLTHSLPAILANLKGLVEAISNTDSCIPLTSPPLEMETKNRRQPKGTVIIGKGAATVKIYPFTRKNGYKQNNVCWHEGVRRRTRCFADFG